MTEEEVRAELAAMGFTMEPASGCAEPRYVIAFADSGGVIAHNGGGDDGTEWSLGQLTSFVRGRLEVDRAVALADLLRLLDGQVDGGFQLLIRRMGGRWHVNLNTASEDRTGDGITFWSAFLPQPRMSEAELLARRYFAREDLKGKLTVISGGRAE